MSQLSTDQKVVPTQTEQDSVKMLKARPHVGQYVTNLLVWICEIHFFSEEWSL